MKSVEVNQVGLLNKLLQIQKSIDVFVKNKTVGEGKSAYLAVDSVQVLDVVRPMLNELNILLEPQVLSAKVMEGQTASGTTRYFTELDLLFTWIDVDSGETREVKWYGQGVDLAGEKGVGKALTYAERYILMKYFHVPTPKDDPDNGKTTKAGELVVKGTQAHAELVVMYKKAISQMFYDLYGDDSDKCKAAYLAMTKNEKKEYAGVDNIAAVSDAALPVLYAKIKKAYEQRMGKPFELRKDETD